MTSTVPPVSNAERSTRFQLDGAHLAAAAGVAYAIGYVISNVYFARFSILRTDLLRGRYVGAAALFLLVTLIAFAFGHFLVRSRSLLRGKKAFGRLGPTATTLLLGLLIALFWLVILSRFMVDTESPLSPHVVGYFLFGVGAGAACAMAPRAAKLENASDHGPEIQGLILATAIILTLMGAGYFGLAIYPRVLPAFGGSAAWRATIHVSSTNLPSRVLQNPDTAQGASITSGIIIDRSDEYLSAILCTGSSATASATRIELPLQEVRSIELHEVVALTRGWRWIERSACAYYELHGH